jgi:hypothetical protein
MIPPADPSSLTLSAFVILSFLTPHSLLAICLFLPGPGLWPCRSRCLRLLPPPHVLLFILPATQLHLRAHQYQRRRHSLHPCLPPPLHRYYPNTRSLCFLSDERRNGGDRPPPASASRSRPPFLLVTAEEPGCNGRGGGGNEGVSEKRQKNRQRIRY